MSEELGKEEVEKKEPAVTETKGFSITSMVLGIISLVLWCVWYVSIPCAIIAIIFSIIGKKKGGKGMAVAGLVLGIITLSILAIIVLFTMAGVAMFEDSGLFENIMREIETTSSYNY